MAFGDVYKLIKKSEADMEAFPTYLVYLSQEIRGLIVPECYRTFVVGHDHYNKFKINVTTQDGIIKKNTVLHHKKGNLFHDDWYPCIKRSYGLIPTVEAPKAVRWFVDTEILLYSYTGK